MEKIVEAECFRVRDRHGRPRAILGLDENDRTRLELHDAGGALRAELSVHGDGDVGLSLFRGEGMGGATLVVNPAGAVVLSLHDSAGRLRAALAVSAQGAPHLVLSHTEDLPGVELRLAPEGSVVLTLSHPQTDSRVELGIDASGRSGIALVDENGQLSFAQPES